MSKSDTASRRTPALPWNSPEFQHSLNTAIYEATPQGILVVDAYGNIVFHNPRLFEVWDISPEDVTQHDVGLPDRPLLTRVLEKVRDPKPFLARIQALYAQPELADSCEVELLDGRTLERHSKALMSHEDQYLGRVWFFRDITEKKQAVDRLRESETRFRKMFESNDAVMLLIDPEHGHIIDANRAASKFYGYAIERMRTMRIDEINTLPPDKIAEERNRSLKLQRNYFIFPHRLANNEIRTVEVHSSPIMVNGKLLLFSIIHDITRQHQAEQELRIAAIAFDSQEGMFVTDANQRILRTNRAFTDITGYSEQEAIGQSPAFLHSGKHDAAFYASMWKHITEKGTWQGEIWNRRKSGEIYPEWLTITAVRDEAGQVTHYVAAMTDISLRKASEEAIAQMAFYDVLTLLPNRRMLIDRLRQAVASSKRERKFGAVIFLDLDNFKPLNDRHGHSVGDMLLIEVARRLQHCIRQTDTVARFGGDEFVVLLGALGTKRQTSEKQAFTVAEKIRAALAKPYVLKPATTDMPNPLPAVIEHHCTASIGMTLFKGENEEIDMDEIITQADQAMYQAKRDGRNRISMFSSEH